MRCQPPRDSRRQAPGNARALALSLVQNPAGTSRFLDAGSRWALKLAQPELPMIVSTVAHVSGRGAAAGHDGGPDHSGVEARHRAANPCGS